MAVARTPPDAPPASRIAYAAARAVADPFADPAARGPRHWTGTRHCGCAGTCGPTGCASRRPWTPRSATWAWTGAAARELTARTADAARDMIRGAQPARSLPHLAEVFRMADYAGLFPDPELAVRRMTALPAQYGIAS